MAIEQGLTILGWFENLSKDEVPPEHIWEDTEGLDEWWRDVAAKREDGVKSVSGRKDDDDDDDDGPVMVKNDYAEALKRTQR